MTAPLPRPAAPPAPPAEAWTLGATLDEIARRGATVRLASTGLKLVHAHRMPDLARAVARHAAALALWARLGGDAGTRAVARGWDREARLHAAWFLRHVDRLTTPLALASGHVVRDLGSYRTAVADRLALGPDAPGADALRATLAGLFARHASDALAEAMPAPRVPARTAAA